MLKTFAACCLVAVAVPAAASDLPGVWLRKDPGAPLAPPSIRMTAWGEARFRSHRPTTGPRASTEANDPTLVCDPPGVPYILTVPVPFELIETSGRVLQLFEYNHNVRQIFTSRASHPADLADTERAQWMGDSVGRWEGDTFVVDTTGFNDRTWLDRDGHPHSAALHLVERLRLLDAATLEYEVTVDDPIAYEAPWTSRLLFTRKPGWSILEHHCLLDRDEYRRYKEEAWQPSR